MNSDRSSGNTTASDGNKSFTRSAYMFCVEINPSCVPHLDDIINYFRHGDPNYILCGSHVGSSQGLHYHLFVQYPKKTTRTIGKRTTFGAHCEVCFASAQQNVAYIRCQEASGKHEEEGVTYGGDYLEEGTMRLRGGVRTLPAREIADFSDEDMLDLNGMDFLMANKVRNEVKRMEANHEYFNQAHQIIEQGVHFDAKKSVHYYTGSSRSGKTLTAKLDMWKKHRPEDTMSVTFDDNGFAHCVGNCINPKALIIEEFRDGDMKLKKFLELTDMYATTLNIKGSSIPVNVEDIYIASVIPVCKLYQNATTRFDSAAQIYNRITEYVHMTNSHRRRLVDVNAWEHFDYQWAREDDYANLVYLCGVPCYL